MKVFIVGNVVFVNVFGNGVVDDKGIYVLIFEFICFYLSEELFFG